MYSSFRLEYSVSWSKSETLQACKIIITDDKEQLVFFHNTMAYLMTLQTQKDWNRSVELVTNCWSKSKFIQFV